VVDDPEDAGGAPSAAAREGEELLVANWQHTRTCRRRLRGRLKTTTESVERISGSVGFGDAQNMRRAFVRIYGSPPQSIRRSSDTKCGSDSEGRCLATPVKLRGVGCSSRAGTGAPRITHAARWALDRHAFGPTSQATGESNQMKVVSLAVRVIMRRPT